MGKHRYGWQPDVPDYRDYRFAFGRRAVAQLPTAVDLRPLCPPIYDQGELGSCTAQAIAAAHEFGQMKQPGGHDCTPSRLFIYYNERVIEGTIMSDAGAQLRDGLKTVADAGVCPESMWPYKVSMFTKRPPAPCYKEAARHQIVKYQRVSRTLVDMKVCLAAGYPFCFGFAVYEGFETDEAANTGIVNMPKKKEDFCGGHAVLCVGYAEKTRRFLVRNSWGDWWGQKGCFTIPFDYLTDPDLADDFWHVILVEEP